MYCKQCGAQLPDGANYCPNCGASTGFLRNLLCVLVYMIGA